jgi:hypothetical protein
LRPIILLLMKKKIALLFSLIGLLLISGPSIFAQLQPGDMVFVAYRMNATSTEDEVAILTLVDILPGTAINFTDSKYTENTPAQCPDGLVWTSPADACVPAGTIITIQPNVPATSIGAISGNKFGLSSTSDQVIVYTGTNTNPVFITALSSNDWVDNNTSCGGNLCKKPATLTAGQTCLNMSTAPGNASGNTANAYYNGTQTASASQLKLYTQNPANWVTAASGTAAQAWPTWAFPGPPTVVGNKVVNGTTLQVFFSRDLDNATATNSANFTGVSGLVSVTKRNNGTLTDTLELTFSTPFTENTPLTLTVANIKDSEGFTMTCTNDVVFTYTKPTNTGIAPIATSLVTCSVYPTPTNGSLNIKYNLETDGIIEIHNVEGKKVLTYKLPQGNNTAGISVAHLPNGVYTYDLLIAAGTIASGKLVVLK